MTNRRELLALLAVAATGAARPVGAEEIVRDPLLARVEAGELPPLSERLPRNPRICDPLKVNRIPGRHGGMLRMLIGGQRDIRYMTIFGYARLVGYTEKLEPEPDILESYTVEDNRIFTLKLRPGHKWSDGHPLTTEDFRYCWEDVRLDEKLSPAGLPQSLMAEGKPGRFEVVDELTVRYSWEAPNPDFLAVQASAQPESIVMPAHYLKQFHEKYQDADALARLIKKNKAKSWTQLHANMARQYRPENPNLPMLDPWINTTKPPAERFVFVRNPYFHRIDGDGRQLPYVDGFILDISSSNLIPAKTGAGDSDIQGTGIQFEDYTFLKEAETRHGLKVLLWERTQGSRVALFPNLNYADDVWRKVLQDVRFRRALSLAIDRHEINMATFFGLGHESADTMLPESPLYRKEYAEAWIAHDPARANALLDEMGLDKRDDDGMRILPDGRVAWLIAETSGESTIETDLLELITDYWRQIGLPLSIRASQIDVFRSRAIAGQTMVAVSSGIDNAIATPDMDPSWLAPTSEDRWQWPMWGMHYATNGKKGSVPDLPEAHELLQLLDDWHRAPDRQGRTEIWHKMLKLYTDQAFSIGLVNATLQPIVISAKLKNIPAKAFHSFDPTCYFGVYRCDLFWLDEGVA